MKSKAVLPGVCWLSDAMADTSVQPCYRTLLNSAKSLKADLDLMVNNLAASTFSKGSR